MQRALVQLKGRLGHGLACSYTAPIRPIMQTDTEPSGVAFNETAIFEQAFLKHNWTISVGNVRKPKTEQDREMYFFIAKSAFRFFVYRTIISKNLGNDSYLASNYGYKFLGQCRRQCCTYQHYKWQIRYGLLFKAQSKKY